MIKAIETRYKGYHFRSRLEARWAVFFDTLGVPWEYEPEGYGRGADQYLPDFRLWRGSRRFPEGLFVEVKGDPEGLSREAQRNTDRHEYGGVLPGFNESYETGAGGLLLLGDIPDPHTGPHLHKLIQHKGGLVLTWAVFDLYKSPLEILIDDWTEPTATLIVIGGRRRNAVYGTQELAEACGLRPWDAYYHIHDGSFDTEQADFWRVVTASEDLPGGYGACRAYAAARSARFEHGASGAT